MAAPGTEALVERELEIAHLQRAVDHARHGVGRAVVIEGPAGIGKTSLIGMAAALAREAGMDVFCARGSELERSFAFGVVRQLFEAKIRLGTEAERAESLAGAAELAAPLFDARAAEERPTGGESIYPRLHGLYWMCANLARRRPLALCVDDAQWADDPSLDFLGFLSRRLEDLPALLVAAIRRTNDDREVVTALLEDPSARVLKPRGLSERGVERILSRELGDPVEEHFVQACHVATGGNPFLLRELVQELQEREIPPVADHAPEVEPLGGHRLADAVLVRLARLSPDAPDLARAVAILGDGAGVPIVAALAGMEEARVLRAASAMRRSDILTDGRGLTFAHPIIRAAVYDSIAPAERTSRHARAATLLHDRTAPAEQVAAQLLHTDEVEAAWAPEVLAAAARSALALGAPQIAVSYLRRALEVSGQEPDRADLLAWLGRSEALAGLSDAAGHLEQAVHATRDPDERARSALILAQLLKRAGRAERSVELLSALEPPRDHKLSDSIETELLSTGLISERAHDLLAERIAAVVARGGAAGTDRERFELVLIAFERTLDNRPVAEILELLSLAAFDPVTVDDPSVTPPGVVMSGALLIYCDQLDEATAYFTSMAEHARRAGSPTSQVLALGLRAEAAYRRGDLGAALADADAALHLADTIAARSPVLLLHPIAVINNVAVEQDRSKAQLDGLLARTDQHLDHDTLHRGHSLVSRARLLSAGGRPKAALDALLGFRALGRPVGTGTPAIVPWRSEAALLMHQLGDPDGAERLAHEEVELAEAWGAPRARSIALRAYGLVRASITIDVLQEAADVLEGSPARLERARALVDLGAALRRAGKRAASRMPLREGHDLAASVGATRLAERARQEIASSGGRVAPGGAQGVASLTPSERRVAELAAEGHSNHGIAQTLFITDKTVETHLRHIYDKLDVRSRHKLKELLEQAPTPSP